MEKLHFQNVIKSFFLGVLIGIILQFDHNVDATASFRFLVLLSSGSIGFIIGLITEWVTSKLPISYANAKNYFLINNTIALFITVCIMLFSFIITNGKMEEINEFLPILWIVLGIVFIANVTDYILYIRAQSKLRLYKGGLNRDES